MERGDAYAQTIQCGPYSTVIRMGAKKPSGVPEHLFECVVIRKADKIKKDTFVHPIKSKMGPVRVLEFRCFAGCVQI